MIKINNNTQDLVLQVEEYTNISKVFNLIDLDTNEILIICPILFLQRFIQYFDNICDSDLGSIFKSIEDDLSKNNSYLNINLEYKAKWFKFNFIITNTELKTINHPINGSEEYKVGFNIIDIK